MGVRGVGASREAAFEQAAAGMCALMTALDTVRAEEKVSIQCEAPDDETLLVDWLNAIVFEMASRRLAFSRFEVEIRDHALAGSVWGEGVDAEKHHPGVEVKGATFTEVSVRKEGDGSWIAQCVVDV